MQPEHAGKREFEVNYTGAQSSPPHPFKDTGFILKMQQQFMGIKQTIRE